MILVSIYWQVSLQVIHISDTYNSDTYNSDTYISDTYISDAIDAD